MVLGKKLSGRFIFFLVSSLRYDRLSASTVLWTVRSFSPEAAARSGPSSAGIGDHALHLAPELLLEQQKTRLLFDRQDFLHAAELLVSQRLHSSLVFSQPVEDGLDLRLVRLRGAEHVPKLPHVRHLFAHDIPSLLLEGTEQGGQLRACRGIELERFREAPDPDRFDFFSYLFPLFFRRFSSGS